MVAEELIQKEGRKEGEKERKSGGEGRGDEGEGRGEGQRDVEGGEI